MREIKTATGKVFMTDMVAENPSPRRLYIRIIGSKMSEVAAAFEDPAEAAKLTYGPAVYTGYTLLSIVVEGGAIRITMKKE